MLDSDTAYTMQQERTDPSVLYCSIGFVQLSCGIILGVQAIPDKKPGAQVDIRHLCTLHVLAERYHVVYQKSLPWSDAERLVADGNKIDIHHSRLHVRSA
jgi:hypothetical protein